jgi:hypothetical protein
MVARTIVAAAAFALALAFAAQAQVQVEVRHCSSGTWCGPGFGCCKPGLACAPSGGCMKPGYHDCGPKRGLCPPHYHCAPVKGCDPDEKYKVGKGAQRHSPSKTGVNALMLGTAQHSVGMLRPVTDRARV